MANLSGGCHPGNPRNKPFTFEKFWLNHPNFIHLVEKWWHEPLDIKGTNMYKLERKLRYIKNKIKEWNVTEFGNIFKEKTIIEEKLEQIHKSSMNGKRIQESTE